MRLINMEILPKGDEGWRSDLMTFGKHITQLYGPNGCGKTPLIKSIAYALGHPCIFRQDIYDHCHSVILKLETHTGNILIKRVFHKKDFNVEVIDSLANKKIFYNEKDFSNYIFDLVGYRISDLISTKNVNTNAYMSTVLPFFYINQDRGYTRIYTPENAFIQDQFSEMIRLIADLPVKNSFNAKKEKLLAKDTLNLLDKQVEEKKRQFEIYRRNISENINGKSIEELNIQIENVENEIEFLKRQGGDSDQAIISVKRLINRFKSNNLDVDKKINGIRSRISGIGKIIEEINTEVDTLNLNEKARRIFLSFDEICGSNNCKLFSESSDAYSKNLLYLKDQIKDLERNRDNDLSKINELNAQKINNENEIIKLCEEIKILSEISETASIINVISLLKDHLYSLNDSLSELDRLKDYEINLKEVEDKRNRALENYNSYSNSTRNEIPSIFEFKFELRDKLIKWFQILKTKNISYDIDFNNDFMPVLGGEKITNLTGSTLTRAVLAFHAALIEVLSRKSKDGFKFLILDTPKQHEIHADDLNNYILELKKICKEKSIQIIFSTTEYHYKSSDEVKDNDIEWNPIYPNREQNMFLQTR